MDKPKGYVEIKLGERTIPLLFNKRFEAKVCAAFQAGIFEVFEMLAKIRIDVLQYVLFYGYEQGMRYRGKEIDSSVDEMADWMDASDDLTEVFGDVAEALSELYNKKKPTESSSSVSSNSGSTQEKSANIPATK
jgi:hypothetical protein